MLETQIFTNFPQEKEGNLYPNYKQSALLKNICHTDSDSTGCNYTLTSNHPSTHDTSSTQQDWKITAAGRYCSGGTQVAPHELKSESSCSVATF